MKEINLREFYPWYMEDVMVEVTEEVAEELLAGQRYIKASRRRIYRNKAHYSLDAEDGIEYSACFSNPSPQELIERMERFEHIFIIDLVGEHPYTSAHSSSTSSNVIFLAGSWKRSK